MNSYYKNYDFIEFKNLLKAATKCMRGVRWKTSVTSYEMNKLKNTTKLVNELMSDEYRISDYQVFEIYEPKKRTILATKLRDRQVQRSLCDNYLYDEITRHFIYDNCACQKGKGTHFAVNRLKIHLQKMYRTKKSNNFYYLKCDIHHFFESINHEMLKNILNKKVRNDRCRKMIFEIIDSFGESGLGLGSQVSQLLALLYIDPLDHYIKEKLHIKHYVRYMDDFILLHEDKEYLNHCNKEIQKFLDDYKLTLNSKTCLQPIKKSVVFLNFRYCVSDSGKVTISSSKKKIAQRRRKLKKIINLYHKNKLTKNDVKLTLRGMLAHLNKYNTIKERNQLIEIYLSSI